MDTKCQFISIENIWNGDIKITIPDIQRGLVWNAAQIEVFWDSLLRGIPIGLFSVADSAGELILLDGQQRWNAVNAAKTNQHGVLWCAILPDPAKLNIYNRKYLFRSTYGKRKASLQPIGRGIFWWDESDNQEGLTAENALVWLKEKSYTAK